MVPLKILEDGLIRELSTDVFSKGIIDLCEAHRKENRALAFAFLLYDFENPQIFKIIEDSNYWNALNTISGKYLSVYYIHSRENTFGEDLSAHNGYENRGLHPIENRIQISSIMPMLKKYLALDEDVKLPAILFFQVEDKLISDYFIIELFKEKMEESFLELKDYIISAVNQLKMIEPDNYGNFKPIFESLKQRFIFTNLRNVLFRNVQKFPIKFLVDWIIR